jgi:DNA repair protein RecN (Recombination protein N)
MLKSLFIKNIATIDSITVNFSPGLNAITGETGAGKSILIGGLELALGERSSSGVIRAGEKLAVVEACFNAPLPDSVFQYISNQLQLEYQKDEALVIRREISRKGKNRCFINGQMISVSDLRHVGECLVDLHGQHEHQSLFHTSAHRDALDAFASNDTIREKYRKAWEKVVFLRRRKEELDKSAVNFENRLDYLDYQIGEIENLNPEEGEISQLEIEEKRLAHAETLACSAYEIYTLLYEGEGESSPSVLSGIDKASRLLDEIIDVEKQFKNNFASLENARVIVEDLAFSMRDYAEDTQADPKRLEEVISRLDNIRRLIRKHGGSEGSLFKALKEMKSEREQMFHDDEEQKKINGDLIKAESTLGKAGFFLSKSRKNASGKMCRKILSILKKLAMEKAEFTINIDELEKAGQYGIDRVEFMLAANPGLPSAPLRKVASGGELSRVMLAVKSVLAGRDFIPTLVFDEIDAGISAEICGRVGEVMKKLSRTHQILCITHSASISARALRHVSLIKKTRKGHTYTEMLDLEGEARLEELARMVGGKDSKAALNLARQMMEKGAR